MAHRGSQNSFTAAVTPLLMMSRRSGESILSSSSRLMIEPASSRAAGIRAFLSTTRSEEHTSELQSHHDLVCRLLLEKKKRIKTPDPCSIESSPTSLAAYAETTLNVAQ